MKESNSEVRNQADIITPQMILLGISEYYNLDPVDITTKLRSIDYIRPRQIFIFLCREMTDISLNSIAVIVNKPNYCNIIHDLITINKEVENNEEVRKQIEDIKYLIKTFYCRM